MSRRDQVRRELARQLAIEAELLRQQVTSEADAAWQKVDALMGAELGTLDFERLLAAADEAATAMDRHARVFGLY